MLCPQMCAWISLWKGSLDVTAVFQSLLWMKCMPALMIKDHILNQKWSKMLGLTQKKCQSFDRKKYVRVIKGHSSEGEGTWHVR